MNLSNLYKIKVFTIVIYVSSYCDYFLFLYFGMNCGLLDIVLIFKACNGFFFSKCIIKVNCDCSVVFCCVVLTITFLPPPPSVRWDSRTYLMFGISVRNTTFLNCVHHNYDSDYLGYFFKVTSDVTV